ncbi:MAG TPA: amidase [Microthrixaceae bacterium]|nr:amidase [Microthrixaceae bacterium]
MTDSPWKGDASSLVDAFRKGEHSPREEMEATLAAIERSELNAFSHIDAEAALAAADSADVWKPFGGVPFAIKELDQVAGWPDTEASLVFKGRRATETSPYVERSINDGGFAPVGLTTASEFGGLNVSVTKINGITRNPWKPSQTVGGSSAGSAAAVSGGLITMASGGDGGGSIRIPAGYTGLLGMKGTFGRIPRGPAAPSRPNTVVHGAMVRSVRDIARFYDVTCGQHPWDPLSLPNPGDWEANLDAYDLRGRKVAVIPDLGSVTLDTGVDGRIREHADALIAAAGLVKVDLELDLHNITAEWAIGNLSTLLAELDDRWPACAPLLTDAIADGLRIATSFYNLNTAAVAEQKRLQLQRQMADAFEQVDFIIAATNPGPAFPAEWETSNPLPEALTKIRSGAVGRGAQRALFGGIRAATGVAPRTPLRILAQAAERAPEMFEMGGLTIPSNIYGNPAVSIPAGTVDGLPIGLQVLARHHQDALLLDLARCAERHLPWPLVAPTATSATEVSAGA